MKLIPAIGYFVIAMMATGYAWSQVEELSNTEMTEAYIQDGTIVVKQKIVKSEPIKTNKKQYKVGKIEPMQGEHEQVLVTEQQSISTLELIQQDSNQRQTELQLQDLDHSQTIRQVAIPAMLSTVAQSQQDQAYAIVRNGLNLPDNTAITPDLLGQYLAGFSGQSTGNPLTAQQTINSTGIQFIIPNNQQINPGSFTSGDGNLNTQINDQQLLFNILYPKP